MLTSSGATLVELTIAMAISTALVLFSAMGAATISQELGYFQQQLTLQSELRLMSRSLSLQLQRAGYVARTFEEIFANGALLPPPIEISHHPLEVENSCVLFSYDKNADGDISHENPAELLGFRLRNKALEYRVASKSCEQGGWHDLTDASELNVTQFTISLHGEVNRALVYKVKLTFQSKASVELSAEQHLYIRVANAL
jgi:prepilin peptidase dependent protein B